MTISNHSMDMIVDREEWYLRYGFGFDDDMEQPLTETARHFHLSENRARFYRSVRFG